MFSVFGLGTLSSLRLGKRGRFERRRLHLLSAGSLTCAMVIPLSGLMEPSPAWGQEVSVILTVSQTLASDFQLSSRCN